MRFLNFMFKNFRGEHTPLAQVVGKKGAGACAVGRPARWTPPLKNRRAADLKHASRVRSPSDF